MSSSAFDRVAWNSEAEHIAARARSASLCERFECAAVLLSSLHEGERIAGIALLRALWRDAGASGNQDASGGEGKSGDAGASGDAWGEPVEDVLSAFVRRRTSERGREDKLAPDVQSALSALGERPAAMQSRPLDLSNARLRGVEWPFARLRGALLMNTDLCGALLVGADLRGAWLRGADLELANLDGADLRGADLRGARGTGEAQLRAAQSDARTLWPASLTNLRR